MNTEISLARGRGDLAELFSFRYEIYVEELGRFQKYADHTARLIRDPLDASAQNLVARVENKIVGCLRINFARDGNLEYYRRLLRMDEIGSEWRTITSLSTRLMIAPDWRGSTLAIRLASAAYELGLAGGIEWNFIDCYSPLVRFFSRLGWIRTHTAEHVEYGYVNVMRLRLRDVEHLGRLRSPFADILERHLELNKPTGVAAAA